MVVPLAQRNVSAGQMVLLQAAALGKPVVITETATTREYVTDGEDALLVRYGDVADMRAKIAMLLADPVACATIGQRASDRYDAEFCTEAYVRRLLGLLREVCGARAETAIPCIQRQSA